MKPIKTTPHNYNCLSLEDFRSRYQPFLTARMAYMHINVDDKKESGAFGQVIMLVCNDPNCHAREYYLIEDVINFIKKP